MKKITTLALILFSLNLQAKGGDGISVGDGGQGVLCRKGSFNKGSFKYSLETLDLYEARAVFGRHWKSNAGFREELKFGFRDPQICAFLASRSRLIGEVLGANHPFLNSFKKACKLEPKLTYEKLPPTNDAGKLQEPLRPGCKIVQLGLRQPKSNTVWLHEDLAQFLSVRGIASILLHEALHEYFDEKDSNLVIRQAVIYTFGSNEFRECNQRAFQELVSTKAPLAGGFVRCE